MFHITTMEPTDCQYIKQTGGKLRERLEKRDITNKLTEK